ncbi:MAG TPA: EMC3/TMCO1 family protein [Candidatus Acidoferrales bacterium]|nr:EMC3/TMCO1 family protein [Candidatus Acidoferrales bacterium]
MKFSTRASIMVLAVLVAVAVTFVLVQPSAAQQTPIPTSGAIHVYQSVTTNSTTTASTNSSAPFGLGFITTPIVAWVSAALTPYIGNPPQIPLSTLFTIGVAACMALISSTAAKVLVDYDMVRSTMKEVQAWQKELNAAKKAKDEQTTSKLMKKSQAMMKQQSRASMEQMKVTAVTFVPFLLIWYLLNAVLGANTVAFAPFPLPIMGTSLRFFYWYLLCSFSVNLPLMRIFGIGMSDS